MYSSGIGCLYVRDRKTIIPQLNGGGQEGGLRGGTENVALIVALGHACHLVKKYWNEETPSSEITRDDELFDEEFRFGAEHMRKMRKLLQSEIQELLMSVRADRKTFE